MKSVLSKILVKIRKHWGLSQDQAAIKIGIKRPTLGAYEEGRTEPSLQILQRILVTYGIEDPMTFIFDSDYLMETKWPKVNMTTELEIAYSKLNGRKKRAVSILLGIEL